MESSDSNEELVPLADLFPDFESSLSRTRTSSRSGSCDSRSEYTPSRSPSSRSYTKSLISEVTMTHGFEVLDETSAPPKAPSPTSQSQTSKSKRSPAQSVLHKIFNISVCGKQTGNTLAQFVEAVESGGCSVVLHFSNSSTTVCDSTVSTSRGFLTVIADASISNVCDLVNFLEGSGSSVLAATAIVIGEGREAVVALAKETLVANKAWCEGVTVGGKVIDNACPVKIGRGRTSVTYRILCETIESKIETNVRVKTEALGPPPPLITPDEVEEWRRMFSEWKSMYTLTESVLRESLLRN